MSSVDATMIADQSLATSVTLAQRLREVGIALFECAMNGEMIVMADDGGNRQWARASLPIHHCPLPACEQSTNPVAWLLDMVHTSPIFRRCVKDAVNQWSAQDEPRVVEVLPGMWLAPMPLLSRRRRVGFAVAVICTEELLQAEQLAAMCQAANMDFELCKRQLAKLPLAATVDVDRLAALVRLAHADQVRATTDSQAIESIGKQLAESYEIENLLYTITQSMTVQERPERFIAQACNELLATLPYAWIGLQLNDDRSRLKNLAGRLIVAGDTGQRASAIRSTVQSLLKIADPETPMVLEPFANPKHASFAALGKTVLVQPVADHGDVIGLLLAGDKHGPDPTASNIDIKLLGATATHMAIFLENAALYHDLNAMFLGTLEALTASIDAKDRYTCGHSRRVAHLTQALARAIGIDEQTVARCHIAGLVHDVGKIGVPETVLLKPGKLNDEEFAWIRKHPEIGHRILKDIPQLNDILPGVLYHHERWDGRGYPDGLSGEAIPLVARLIGLADSFDAMSSTRTYRSALSRPQVLAEIDKCAGSQFDPTLAAAFLKLDFTAYDRMAEEHRASEMSSAMFASALRQEKAA